MAERNQQQGTQSLSQTTWEGLNEPGAYVEENTGNLFRVPAESLVTGASPIIERVSKQSNRLFKVSDNPYAPIQKCRAMAADANVLPNF